MHIILVGIQWSGKGTQARKIVQEYGYHFFEMGFKLRQFGELDHPLSPTVKADLTAGRLVSLETIATILKHYQSTHTGGSIVFDGIPRNAEQKHMFDTIFPEHIIIFLNLNKDIAIERLAGRKIDPETGESFPASFDGQFSPYTGHRLIKRADDTPAIVEKRIDTFYQNTLPLLAHWAESGKRVYTVDASWDVESVYSHIRSILSAYTIKKR